MLVFPAGTLMGRQPKNLPRGGKSAHRRHTIVVPIHDSRISSQPHTEVSFAKITA